MGWVAETAVTWAYNKFLSNPKPEDESKEVSAIKTKV
jgi:hypothetical protein